MDYEKKYKDALELAKSYYGEKTNEFLDTIFPELISDKDESTRKDLINFLQSPFMKENVTDEKVAPWLAYLEKQKQSEWSEKDNIMGYKLGLILFDHAFSHGEVDVNGNITGKYVEIDNWLKSLKPQPKWKPSEEQMEELNKARRFILYNCDVIAQLYEDLKKL